MENTETKTFTIALCQMRVVPGEVDRNLDHAVAMVEEASRDGADVVVLPEVLDCGWCDQSAREHAEPIPDGARLQKLIRTANECDVFLCAGLAERVSTPAPAIYNSAVLIDRVGFVLLTHRKVNELEFARDLYATGEIAPRVDETVFAKFGLMICADAFLPGEPVARSLADLGAQVILSPCAWAVPPDHDQERDPYGDLWRDVYGRIAKECGIWIAATSNVGSIRHGAWSGHHCIGCSMLVGPDGEVHACGSYGMDAEEIVYAEVVT